MIEVNSIDLKINIGKLNLLIDEYENIQLNLFNQLKDSCINWQDGNSINFDNNIYLENQESKLFLQNLTNKKGTLNFIYDKYSEIGKKITCNLNSRDTLINTINNCYDQTVNIINEFNKVDKSFYYSEQYSIARQKEKIVDIKNELSELKNSIVKIYDKIKIIEEEINNKIKTLEIIKINSFDFNFNSPTSSTNNVKGGILIHSLFSKNIEQINFYADEEYKNLNKICQVLQEINNNYNSENTNLLSNDVSIFKENINKISEKRVKYSECLNEVILKYNTLANETKQFFNGDV